MHGNAIAQDRPGALRPGDGVRTAIGRIGGMHHAEHRLALLEQGDRNRRAAPPGGVLEGAVVRIDQPHPAGTRAGRDGALLAAELRRDQPLECRLQPLLDLAIERAAAAPAARALRRVELGAQPLALGFDRGDDFRKDVGRRHVGLIRMRVHCERLPWLPLKRPAV